MSLVVALGRTTDLRTKFSRTVFPELASLQEFQRIIGYQELRAEPVQGWIAFRRDLDILPLHLMLGTR